ncbi:MAG: hypothetical protein J6A06_00045 [Fibrobacteraceae bacterium]|nr:hypothetical protein [Fibrobacteraceae bacterium]
MSTHASMVTAAFAALGLQLTSWSGLSRAAALRKQAASISSAKAGRSPSPGRGNCYG